MIVDTLECYEAVEDVLDHFSDLFAEKPVEAIVITHFHADHIGGCRRILDKFPKARVRPCSYDTFNSRYSCIIKFFTQFHT